MLSQHTSLIKQVMLLKIHEKIILQVISALQQKKDGEQTL